MDLKTEKSEKKGVFKGHVKWYGLDCGHDYFNCGVFRV